MSDYDVEAQNAFFNATRKTLVDCLCGASFDKLRFRCWRFGDGASVRCTVCGIGNPGDERGADELTEQRDGIEGAAKRWNTWITAQKSENEHAKEET